MKYRSILLMGMTAALLVSFLTIPAFAQELVEDSMSGGFSRYFCQGVCTDMSVSWTMTGEQAQIEQVTTQMHIIQFVFPGDEEMLSPDRFASGVDCEALTQYEICLSFEPVLIDGYRIDSQYEYCYMDHPIWQGGVSDEETPNATTFSFSCYLDFGGDNLPYWLTQEFDNDIAERGIPDARVLTVAADGQIETVGSTPMRVESSNGYVYDSFSAEYVPNVGVVLTYDLFPSSFYWNGNSGQNPPNTLIRKQESGDFSPIVSSQAILTATDGFDALNTALDTIRNEDGILYGNPSPETSFFFYYDSEYPTQTIDRDVSVGETIYYQLAWFNDIATSYALPQEGFAPFTDPTIGWGDIISITIPMTATALPTFEWVEDSFAVQQEGSTYTFEWETAAEYHVEQFGIGWHMREYAGFGLSLASITTTATADSGTGANYTISWDADVYWDWNSESPTFQLYRFEDGLPIFLANAAVSEAVPLTVSLNDVSTITHSVWVMVVAVGLGIVTAALYRKKYLLTLLIPMAVVLIWPFLTLPVSAQQVVEDSVSGYHRTWSSQGGHKDMGASWMITATNQAELDLYAAQTYIVQVIFPGDEPLLPPERFINGVDCSALISQYELCSTTEYEYNPDVNLHFDSFGFDVRPRQIETENIPQTVTMSLDWSWRGSFDPNYLLLSTQFEQDVEERGIPSVRILTVAANGQVNTIGSGEMRVENSAGYTHGSFDAEYVPDVGVVLTYDLHVPGFFSDIGAPSPNKLIRKSSTNNFLSIVSTQSISTTGDIHDETAIALDQILDENSIWYATTHYSEPDQTIDRDVTAGETVYYQLNWSYKCNFLWLEPEEPCGNFTTQVGWGDTISVTIPSTATPLSTFELAENSFTVQKNDSTYIFEWETTAEADVEQFMVGHYQFALPTYDWSSSVREYSDVATTPALGGDNVGARYTVSVNAESIDTIDSDEPLFVLYRMDGESPIMIANAAVPASTQELVADSISGAYNQYFCQGSCSSMDVSWTLEGEQTAIEQYKTQMHIIQFVFPGDEEMLSPNRFTSGVDCDALTQYELCLSFQPLPSDESPIEWGCPNRSIWGGTISDEGTQNGTTFHFSCGTNGEITPYWITTQFGHDVVERGVPHVRVLTVAADGQINTVGSTPMRVRNFSGYVHDSFNAEYMPDIGVVLTYDLHPGSIAGMVADTGIVSPDVLIRKQENVVFTPLVFTLTFPTEGSPLDVMNTVLNPLLDTVQNENGILYGNSTHSPDVYYHLEYPTQTVDRDVSPGETIYYQLNWLHDDVLSTRLHSHDAFANDSFVLGTQSIGWGDIVSVTIPMTATTLPTFEWVEDSFTVQKEGSIYTAEWETAAEYHVEQFGVGMPVSSIYVTTTATADNGMGTTYTLSWSRNEHDYLSAPPDSDSFQLYRYEDGLPIFLANTAVAEAVPLTISLHNVSATADVVWVLFIIVGLGMVTAVLCRKKHLLNLFILVAAAFVWSSLTHPASAQEIVENSLSSSHRTHFSMGTFVSADVSWMITAANDAEFDDYVAQTHIIQYLFPGDEAMLSPNRFTAGVDCTTLTPYEACVSLDSGTVSPCSYNISCGASYDDSAVRSTQTVTVTVYWSDTYYSNEEARWLSDEFEDEIREKGIPSVRVLAVSAAGDVTVLGSTELVARNANGYVHGSFNAEYVPNEGVVLTHDTFDCCTPWIDFAFPSPPQMLIRKQGTSNFPPFTTPSDIATTTQAVEAISSLLNQTQNENSVLYHPSGYRDFGTDYPTRTVDSDVSAGDTIYYQLNWFQHSFFTNFDAPITHLVGWGATISITIPMTATALPTFELVEDSFTVQKTGSTYELTWETTAEPNVEQFGIGALGYDQNYGSISHAEIITTTVQGGNDMGASYSLSLDESDILYSDWSVDSFHLYRTGDDGFPMMIATAAVPEAVPLTISLHTISATADVLSMMVIIVGLGIVTAALSHKKHKNRSTFGHETMI